MKIKIKQTILCVLMGIVINNISFSQSENYQAQQVSYDDVLLNKIRNSASSIPGEKPLEIRYIKFAESPRTFGATIQGGNSHLYVQARTAYQLVYKDATIMIDAGMDEEVHNFFGRKEKQPYFQDKYDSIQIALNQTNKVLITHEHGDHVAGVLRTKNYQDIAPKTILTYQQVHTLLNKPQMPQLQMDEKQIKDFVVVDFNDILPVAPGVVLIKAPGHTPGEIMIYFQLENSKEYIITGDVSWSYAGVEQIRQKPEDQRKRIGEDEVKIQYQLEWLNKLPEKGIQLLVCHDDIVQPQLIKKGILKKGLFIK